MALAIILCASSTNDLISLSVIRLERFTGYRILFTIGM
jgi:hypothetical protein